MAAESTAINSFIQVAQGRRLDLDDEPDLFSVPKTPERPAKGTKPPMHQAATVVAPPRMIDAATVVTPPQPTRSKPMPAMSAKQYQIPVTSFEDQQTAHWDADHQTQHKAEADTSPPVPKILPNVATMIAQPQAVPSILRGPVAPQPSVPASQPVPRPYAHVVLPPISHSSPVPNVAAPRMPSIAPPSPAPLLVLREVMSSMFRSWVGLGVLGVALALGVYLAVASKSEPNTVKAPTERDRALAIMNGTAQPDPEPAPIATAPAVPPFAVPVVEPIEETKPTAEPIEDTAVAATDEVSVDEIEMEPVAARPAKRTARARKKTVAVAAETPKASKPANDPVLAILNEKPAKTIKAPKNVATAEIAAPRGAAPTKGTGKVTITSDVKALVFLDGRPTGKSAPTALVIPAGDHQITLLDPETKKAKTATVKLEPNKSLAVSKQFN